MRVLLVYNPKAGNGVEDELHGLVATIRAAGHEVRCRSSKDRRLASALVEPLDVVAVAGGDGTVGKVARLLRGHQAAIAPLPLGTANNVAGALGLAQYPLEEQIRCWSEARTIALDLGVARGPWGSRVFLESFGIGLMPTLMAEHRASRKKKSAEKRLAAAVAHARRSARRMRAVEIEAWLDGREISGRYVLLEAMNLGWVGPNLDLAPGADPNDGEFDVVLVRASERSLLADCLRARERGSPRLHALPTVRGRRLRIARGEFQVHIDDELEDAEGSRRGRDIEITLGHSVDFLLPQGRGGAARGRRAAAGRSQRAR